ncbi:unnamed protein product [Tilletia controversa]|uniref:Uncharacterized protein n=1 Tax=Tilletia caries TaxID=13290 RepID=A0A177UYR4_9BASI|nr:hypothetical protein CF336_g3219 [Tilletia laevis]KAE8262370.1 hypothetical protein A4X03_0g2507 [Tilletia caries]CAD6897313.1 unnamed protein product [Tilletia controversa]KAE8205452.1 hypothetical protein CF335_g2289 [Tilletia laevis]CAD6890534.1 unnamed protein product [Tilletia caries]
MKDWIRSPSPDGYDRLSATAPGASSLDDNDDDLELVGGPARKRTSTGTAGAAATATNTAAGTAAFGIRRGVVGVTLPSGTRASTNASTSAAGVGSAMAGVGTTTPPAPPSLKALCLSIVFRNLHQVRDLGFMSFSVARPILEQCQADQLAELLDHSPHLAPDADTLWKRLCFNDFVQIRKDSEAGKLQEPESWRKLYWRTVNEAEEHKAAVAERIKSRYATARAEKDDRKIRVSERPLIRLSLSRSHKWTSGMYGVSNGGLGGNGRPGANTQGQGMLARAAGKARKVSSSSSSAVGAAAGGAGGMMLAGTKRKAGPVVLCGGSAGEPHRLASRSAMDIGDLAFAHAHKVKVVPRTFGSPPGSSGGSAMDATSPPSSSSSSHQSQQQQRRGLNATTTTTRIVKTVVPSINKTVPPGGLDFFGNASSSKTMGKKPGLPQKSGVRISKAGSSSSSSNGRGGGKFSSPPPPLGSPPPLSAPPAPPPLVIRTQTVAVCRKPPTPERRRKESAGSSEGRGGGGGGQHQRRITVRGAVD